MLMRLVVIKHSAYKMKIVKFNWNKCICASIWFHPRIQHKHWIKLRKFIFNLIIRNIHMKYNKISSYFQTKRKFHRFIEYYSSTYQRIFIQIDCLDAAKKLSSGSNSYASFYNSHIVHWMLICSEILRYSSKLFRNCFLYCCMLLDFRFRLTHILNIMDQFIFAHHLPYDKQKLFQHLFRRVHISSAGLSIVNWLFTTYFQTVSEGRNKWIPI